jgi:hypothetical protein
MRIAAPVAVVAAALLCGCNSQWFPGYAHEDIARTDLTIRTEPPGATVVMTRVESAGDPTPTETKKLPAPSPVLQPVEYDHVETLYQRQSNYGTQMREGMGPVMVVLTFPIWAIASIFHYSEEKHVHEYGHNTFVVSAYAPGREDAETTIVLEGEAKKDVLLKLPPVAK